tara:strand:+ start:44344 stop:46008 length:1665 start_codon:yes stop_codon:yes gene_type:complete
MKIIIPMSGFGERFRKAGYKVPKPLIEIEGIHMIGHVINLFPSDSDFIFICNKDHLNNKSYKMKKIIKKYCLNPKIIGIKPHKLGPVHAVLQIEDQIKLKEEVIINYCDFSCNWDWNYFKKFLIKTKCDGAIPAYKGFHPHSLGNTNYAYMKEANGWMIDIQEKKPFTENRMNEYASSGTYYFASGKLLLISLKAIVEQNFSINGEFYVSLAYKELIKRNKKIAVYPLQHFFQWGTPEDLDEYNHWSRIFKLITEKKYKNLSITNKGSLILPMAGLGKRFSDEGYKETKPLINVSGKPMIMKALDDLPSSSQKVFIMRKDMEGYQKISKIIKDIYPESNIKYISKVTSGQASTAFLGIDLIDFKKDYSPITIGACDNGALYDEHKFREFIKSKKPEIIVWGAKNHINAKRNPNMFGWIKADENGLIENISVKKAIENNLEYPIVIGTFTFLKEKFFRESIESLFKRKGLINGEFYIDSAINDAINLGFKCYFYEVDAFISWGTPNELKTFEYMQSALHNCEFHKYELNNDPNIPMDNLDYLKKKYKKINPKLIS